MYERIQGNDVYNNAGTVPLAASVNFNNVVFNNPAQNTATGGTASGSIPVNNITGMDFGNYKAPRSTQFSLGVQQSIGTSVLSVAYVGTQNRHQNYYQELNLPSESLLPGYVKNTAATPFNSAVPYLGYHEIRLARNEANGDYNSLQISLRGQVSHSDLTYQLGYTLSKAERCRQQQQQRRRPWDRFQFLPGLEIRFRTIRVRPFAQLLR